MGGDLPAPSWRGGRRDTAQPDHTHRKGLAAFRKAGGRVVQSVSAATDLVLDGVVGISGSGPLRPAAAEVFAAVDAGRDPGGRRRHPQRHRRGDRRDHRPGRARRADRHLRRTQARARAGRLRSRRADRYRAQPAAHRRAWFRGRRCGRALAGARPARRQVHPGRHRGDGRLVDLSGCGRAVHRRRRRGHLRHGPLHRQRAQRGARALARGHRVAHPGFGRAGAGLGGRAGIGHRRHRRRRIVVRAGHRPAGAGRRRRADHLGGSPRSGGEPHRADRADPARR